MSLKQKTELSWIEKFVSRLRESLKRSSQEQVQDTYKMGSQRIHSPEEMKKKEIKRQKAKITQTRLKALQNSDF